MRVDLAIVDLGRGGAEYQLTLLATGLRERGVDVRVLAVSGGGPHEETLRTAGIPVIHLGFVRPAEGGWRTLPRNARAFVRLVALLRRSKPDVLHAYLFPAYALCVPAARLARVRAVGAGLQSVGRHLAGRPLRLIPDVVATRMAGFVVAVSHSVAGFSRQRLRTPTDRLTVIYNAVPAAAFEPAAPAELSAPGPVVVCVANLYEHKGHRHLIDALALLRDRGVKCTAVLLGAGPEHDRLRAQARALDVDVRLLGSRTDIAAWLARSDLCVLPSLTEAFGIAAVEAMAARRPLIASDVGGLPEIVQNHGVLVPPADPDALADAMEGLLTERPEAERLADAAFAWASTHARADDMIDRHLELFSRSSGLPSAGLRRKLGVASRHGPVNLARALATRLVVAPLLRAHGADSWHVRGYHTTNYKRLAVQLANELPEGMGVVADVGCGMGDVVRRIRARRPYGFDIDAKVIACVRLLHRRSGVAFGVGGPARLPEIGPVDLLIVLNWLHLESDEWIREHLVAMLGAVPVRHLIVDEFPEQPGRMGTIFNDVAVEERRLMDWQDGKTIIRYRVRA